LPAITKGTRSNLDDGRNPTLRSVNDIIKKVQEMTIVNSAEEIQKFEIQENAVRVKRSLDFVGDFSSWCCGIATVKSLDDMYLTEAKMESLAKTMEKQIIHGSKEFMKATKLLNSYSVSLNETIENLEDHWNSDFARLLDTERKLASVVQGNSLALMNLAKGWHDSTVSLIWNKILSDCENNLLSRFLVPPKMLSDDIQKFNETLKLDKQRLAITKENFGRYYHLPLAICSFTEHRLMIFVKIPVRQEASLYEVIQISTIPFQYQEKTCIIQLDTEIVVKNQGQLIALVGQAEKHCKVKENGLCFIPRFTQKPMLNSNCLETMFSEKATVNLLNKHCQFKCSEAMPEKTILTQITGEKFAVINPNETLQVRCRNQREMTVPALKTAGVFEIQVPCGCTLMGIKVYITLSYPCDMTKDVSIHHVIPASWSNLGSAVTNDQAVFMNMTEVFNPNWHVNMPGLNLTVENMDPIEEFPELKIPHVHQVATHASFISIFWMMSLTGWVIYLTLKTMRIGQAAAVVAVGIPAGARGDTTEIVLESFENFLLIQVGFFLLIIIIGIHSIKTILQKASDQNQTKTTTKLDGDDVTIKITSNKTKSTTKMTEASAKTAV